MKTYAFIDASNLFYGGEKSLGWKVDYKKMLEYLKEKYAVTKAFYFAGVELDGYKYSLLDNDDLDLDELLKFQLGKLRRKDIS